VSGSAAWQSAGRKPFGRVLAGAGRLLRWLGFALVILWLVFAGAVIALRYLVLPNLDTFRGEIEGVASRAIGLKVNIERIEAGWDALRPDVRLVGVRIFDAGGREALGFRAVDAVLAWRSLALMEPHFHRLHADGPLLVAERNAEGQIFVAGLPVQRKAQGDPGIADWLLAQKAIGIDNATLVWTDRQRGAPELRMERVSLVLQNEDEQHRFGLVAILPKPNAGRLEVRAEMTGETVAHPGEWIGRFYVTADDVDLAVWKTWVDLPVDVDRGRGALRFWGALAGGRMTEASADLALDEVQAKLGDDLPLLDLTSLSGRLTLRRDAASTRLTGLDIALALADGTTVRPTGFHVQWSPMSGGGTQGLGFITSADLGDLATIAPYLPLDPDTRELLARYAPAGRLDGLQVSWTYGAGRLAAYSVKAGFADLALAPTGRIPGFDGLSGSVEADERGGRLLLDSGPVALEMPEVFAEPRIALDELKAELNWVVSRRDGVLDDIEFNMTQATFSGPDASGKVRGRYRLGGLAGRSANAPGAAGADAVSATTVRSRDLGEIDLSGRLDEADATAVWRYLPRVLPSKVADWLHGALLGGRARGAEFILRGRLADFPFVGGKDGQFLIRTRIEDGRLRYHPEWPVVEDLDADLRFEGSRLDIVARQANTAGMKLARVEARIADFGASAVPLHVVGEAQGSVAGFTRFLDGSPLGETLGRFYEEINIAGDGRLKLDLDIPLSRPESAKVQGQFDLSRASVRIDPMLPPVSDISGRISFTERQASSSELNGQFLGRPLAVSLRADDSEVRVAASGAASVEQLVRHYGSGGNLSLGPVAPLLAGLSGELPWQAGVSVRQGRVRILVESSLQGLASTLPDPLAKPADRALPVRFSRTPIASEKRGKVLRDQFALKVGDIAQATLIRRIEGEKTTIERGVFAIADPADPKQAERLGGEKALPAEGGLRVAVRRPTIDLDAWQTALAHPAGSAVPVAAAAAANAGTQVADIDWPVPTFDVEAKSLRLIGRQWSDVRFTARPRKGGLDGHVEARDTVGDWSWERAGKGTLRARLAKLVLPDDKAPATRPPESKPAGDAAPDSLPAIDVVAEDFVLGKRSLGKVEVVAENEAKEWKISRFALGNPDGNIRASGRWLTGEASQVDVEFALEATDIGDFLSRFGYADAVRDGKGSLSGKLSWKGSPAALHQPSLTGALKVKAEKGQFRQLEPGIGKLLSLISLQALPRRATLDFRDVFSQGFAFDKIEGSTTVAQGVMRTRDLEIDGPAARVLMQGEVDLARDTQDVKVTIQPELGSAVALGTAVAVNPVVGVAALIAQKVLRDPLNKAFAFEYRITGSLADPKVDKIGGPPPDPNAPNEGKATATGKK
jgi:uncharacterized protein (TIGR02099 family)